MKLLTWILKSSAASEVNVSNIADEGGQDSRSLLHGVLSAMLM